MAFLQMRGFVKQGEAVAAYGQAARRLIWKVCVRARCPAEPAAGRKLVNSRFAGTWGSERSCTVQPWESCLCGWDR